MLSFFKRMMSRGKVQEKTDVKTEKANVAQRHKEQTSSQTSDELSSQTSKSGSRFDCRTRIPASQVSFDLVLKVIHSWEKDLKAVPNWQKVGGELLLRKMFELEPECITMFDFPKDTKFDDLALKNSRAFIMKGVLLIAAVDTAVGFLGPDLEPLEDQLRELGGRHVARGCKPGHWPVVGDALFYVLGIALGDKFTPELQQCWVTMYNFLSFYMIEGLLEQQAKLARTSTAPALALPALDTEIEANVPSVVMFQPEKNSLSALPISEVGWKFDCQTIIPSSDISFHMVTAVVNSWEHDLKAVPNWQEVGGELLLRKMFELEPECITMFDFPKDTKYDDPELKNNRAFITKGIVLVAAVDTAVGFLGPDLEPLEEQLRELGGRHVARGCKPRHWPVVGKALFHVLETAIGEKFTPELRQCWGTIYNFLSFYMIEGLLEQEMKVKQTATTSC